MAKRVNVAIIDDSICKINSKNKIHLYELKDHHIQPNLSERNIKLTHGTMCAFVFMKCASNYNLYGINISVGEGKSLGEVESLLIALDWCIENKIELIHLSIGTLNFNYFKCIEEKIAELEKYKIIVVAANRNNYTLTYPAALSNVIGVRCDLKNKIPKGGYVCIENPIDGIEIVAHSKCEWFIHINRYHIPRLIRVEQCNSYTAPFITAKICKMMGKGVCDIKEIKKQLVAEAYSQYDVSHIYDNHHILEEMKDRLDKIKIESPIVVFNNQLNINILELVRDVVEQFKKNQYNCIAIQDRLNSIEKSCYCMSQYRGVQFLKDKIEWIYSMTNPDIMIVEITTYEELALLRNSNLIDIVVNINEQGSTRLYEDGASITISLNQENDLESRVSAIYNFCIAQLSESTYR